jgi:glycosyltransferase 2 family protein
MRYATVLLLVAGSALLGLTLAHADLGQAWSRLHDVGWSGLAALGALLFAASLAQAAILVRTVPSTRAIPHRLYALWKVWMVGEAFNTVTPLGSFGGEPIKAGLLKRHHGVGLRGATAALVLAQTINIIALVLFLVAGFGLMLRSQVIPSAYRVTAGSALAGFAGSVLLLFLTQRHGMLSRVVRLLASTRFGGRAQTLVELVHDVEHRLIAFYTGQRQRFALAAGLAFGYWACGMLRTYTTMACLGRPIAWRDAWMIEAGLLLVRSVLFLVPGNLGTQEAALVMSSTAITGSSTLGLAMAIVRRACELAWVAVGLLVGWTFSWAPDAPSRAVPEPGHPPAPDLPA